MKKNDRYYQKLYFENLADKSYEVRNKVRILKKVINNNINGYQKSIKILEIGFGSGDLLYSVHEKYQNVNFWGLEVVSSAISSFKERFGSSSKIKLVLGSAENLPFNNKFFDFVICSHVIEHLENDMICLKEIFRVLKNGGIAIIAVPVAGESKLHYRQYNFDMLQKLADEANFEIKSSKKYGSWLIKAWYKLMKIYVGKERFEDDIIKSDTSKIKKSGKYLFYYKIIIPILLLISILDDSIAFLDPNPIQIVEIFRKK